MCFSTFNAWRFRVGAFVMLFFIAFLLFMLIKIVRVSVYGKLGLLRGYFFTSPFYTSLKIVKLHKHIDMSILDKYNLSCKG